MITNEQFAAAVAFAARKHKEQTRKDHRTPYIYHPMAVSAFVCAKGFDLEYQTVAVLHDTLEDTDATEDDIAEFGEEVLTAVKLLTRAEGANEEEYVAAILANPIAREVKNADKICNLHDAMGAEVGFAKRYLEKGKKYYQGKFSAELDEALTELERSINV